jgi:pyruvate ferredoxin oxidoreductase delta subunit
MNRSYAVEIVYRGIFQKTLAKHISRGLVLAASKEGKTGISFGRYGDSPERNGIPAKNFAIIAPDEETLEESMAQYEPKHVDVTISVDDTLCKGVESWAWYGLQPINRLLNPGGHLIVTSMLGFDDLLKMVHVKDVPYHMTILRAVPSFSGLWVYKDDHTEVRLLGTIARLLPEMVSLKAVEQAILAEWNDELKMLSARKAYERVESIEVPAGVGVTDTPYEFTLPGWKEMRDGVTISSIQMGGTFTDPESGKTGGYRPATNPYFKKFSTRTMRPVVDFDTCIKCTLCWLQCPDSCFDVTPDQLYDARMESCCGCGVCEAVCPVDKCVTMVNESEFTNNDSQWEMWKADKSGYKAWLTEKIQHRPDRSHGFRFRGQYAEQIKVMSAVGMAKGGQEKVGGEDTTEASAGGS